MSILFSGDFHANSRDELKLITKKTLINKYQKAEYDEIKYHIILGDAGFLWPGNEKTDLFNYKALANRPFPVLCVMGNHEPILGMSDVPEVNIGIGEKVLQINDNPFVAYLKRGGIYKIENHRFLVLGGALSIDKEFRRPNISWWKREYWDEAEKVNLFLLLQKHKKFDYVLSHTGPNRINRIVNTYKTPGITLKFFDEVAVLNEEIDERITCKQWFCGHWHTDKYYYDENQRRGYQYLYEKTALLKNDEIIVL
ncbi:MAG: metallophosphoesterase [Spirochaetes bacterium]|nr:metallophosphoesterase [Brevinematales bacterium]MCL1957977.1 metallophosphoesterase [Spirochaetota bacterium]